MSRRKNVVDCDAKPFVPEEWKVVKHIKGGKFEFDPKKVVLYLDEKQRKGRVFVGSGLRRKLKGLPVFNANLLDFYLSHPNLIPEEWKGKTVFFWGTIYRHSDGLLCIRYLRWDNVSWRWDHRWLWNVWFEFSPAAVLASPSAEDVA